MIVVVAAIAVTAAWGSPLPPAKACPLFPADNAWNRRVDTLPVATGSGATVAAIGATKTMHADFGSGLWEGGPIGIPITVVGKGAAQEPRPVRRTPTSRIPVRTPSRRASLSKEEPRPTGIGMRSSSTATPAVSTSSTTCTARVDAGRQGQGRSGTCARTGFVRRAGRRPTRRACRSSPGSPATTRSRRAGSTMRSGSPSRAPAVPTCGRHATTRARSPRLHCPRWALGYASSAPSTCRAFPGKRASSFGP